MGPGHVCQPQDMLRVPSHPLQYALSLSRPAAGHRPIESPHTTEAEPEVCFIDTETSNIAYTHTVGNNFSTSSMLMKPQLFPHYYKPNHLPRIEALGRVYAYLPREKGWVSNAPIHQRRLLPFFRCVANRQFHPTRTVVLLHREGEL